MANEHVINRLKAIQNILRSCRQGGTGLSNALIGSERESFINLVLGNVISPPFRVGTGQITDHDGRMCGQADIVVEYSNSISFPLLQGNQSRLYLAEGVCCVVEVKSDLEKQWDEVSGKAKNISTLRRDIGTVGWVDPEPPAIIPMFAVGYRGWKRAETCRAKLEECAASAPSLSGLLVIEEGIYVARGDYKNCSADGPSSIFGFLLSIEQLTSSLLGAKPALKPYVDP